jgi:signal transduction histidine kinase
MIKRLFIRHSLAQRLVTGFLLISVLPLAGLAVLNMENFKTALVHTVVEHMAAIADKKLDQIDSYINESRISTKLLASSPNVLEVFRELKAVYPDGIQSKAYQKVAVKIEKLLEKITLGFEFYDLLFIDTTGQVIFSLKKASDLGSNIATGTYSKTVLSEGFHRSISYLSTEFSAFGLYSPSGDTPVAFVVTPLLDDGIAIGVLAVQINLEMYEPIVSDRTGLGKTGETVLAQRNQDVAYFTTVLRYADNKDRNRRVSMGLLAKPMQNALNGERGQGIGVDYVGNKVVAAWRYIPGLHWGMVVKINAGEALEPLDKLILFSEWVLGLLVLLAGIFALIIGRSIIEPIHQIIQVAENIADGDFSQRTTIERQDEIGQLGQAFNHMADEVKRGRDQLELRVAIRTGQLQTAKEEAESALNMLQLTQQSLVQAEKMAALGNMVAGVAHEINTPVGVTLTSATWLSAETEKTAKLYSQGELDSDALDAYFECAHQSSQLITLNSQRAADLIQSFKQVAVDQSSGDKREFVLKSYLEEIILSLGPSLKKTAVVIKLDCPESIVINGYPGALSQIVTNFIMNSLMHAFEPGQKGVCKISVKELNDGQIEFEYRDNGRGIARDIQSRIFEPFFTTMRGKGGSGLGLHLVYNIVNNTLKGSMEFTGEPGKGVCFTIWFSREMD